MASTTPIKMNDKGFRSGNRNANYFGVKVKGKFVFDTKLLLLGVSEAEAKALSTGGFYVMDTARKSIRSPGKKGDPAKAGAPPRSRLGYLKQFIDFQFEPREHRTVVGPRGLTKPASRLIAPRALEQGGPTVGYVGPGTLFDFNHNRPLFGKQARDVRKWLASPDPEIRQRADGISVLTRGRKITMTIAAHPYMQPAFNRNQRKIAQLWKNAL